MGFQIGKNFHIIHMTDDLRDLDTWYYDVFSVRRFMPESYMDAEKRDATLVILGELCIEPLAPAFRMNEWERMPLGRFFNRHGKRFHSLAWYVDEGMEELFEALKAAGVECRGTAGIHLDTDYPGGPVFTHPKDTLTQLEFIPSPIAPGGPSMLGDPRYDDGWSPSWWADTHPLQIQKASHVTVSTFDLAETLKLYVDVLDGKLLHEADNDVIHSHSAFVQVGTDLVLELAQPSGPGPLKDDMERFHHGVHAVSFKVRDIDDARQHLERKGVRFTFEHETTLVTDPTTTQGVVMGFTTWEVPGDERPDWTDPKGGPIRAQMFKSAVPEGT